MDNVIRITFPSFSRLQDNKDILAKGVEKSIFAACFFIFPALCGLVILAPYFIELIPKYGKWEPAILSLGFFALNAAFSSVSTSLTNALNAIGKIKVTLYLMIFWTLATWILTPIAVFNFGFNGVAAVSALVSSSMFFVIYIVKKHIRFSIMKPIFYPLASALIMGSFIYFLGKIIISDFLSLGATIIVGVILYFVIIFIFAKKLIISNLAIIKTNILK